MLNEFNRPTLIRITTVPLSLNVLLKGQLRFMKDHYNVLALSAGPTEELKEVERRERVGKKMQLQLCHVDDIPVEKSGKYRMVKNHIKHKLNE